MKFLARLLSFATMVGLMGVGHLATADAQEDLPGVCHQCPCQAGQPIGTASMDPDGTIHLDLIACVDDHSSAGGDARLNYAPGSPQYQMILDHLGGLKPGELKPVAPFS